MFKILEVKNCNFNFKKLVMFKILEVKKSAILT